MLFLSKLVDLAVLNLLFVISCLPVVTIGAALTAIQYVCITGWDTQNSHIIKMYTKSFKQNLKQSTLVWLLLLVVGVVLGGLTYATFTEWKAAGSKVLTVFLVISVILVILYACVFTFVWPVLAKFENTIGNTLKNALLMSLSHLPGTVVSWLLAGICVFLVYEYAVAKLAAVLFLFSLVAFLQSNVFRGAFEPYLTAAKEEEQERWRQTSLEELREQEEPEELPEQSEPEELPELPEQSEPEEQPELPEQGEPEELPEPQEE
jgi:uncharacterized membrane protein YesL